MAKNKNKDCFVIMPISDCDGYNVGHFTHVYEDIIKPAIISAEFAPVRADDVCKTNFIHLDILEKLIEAPIAVCDLSTRNPNVLYELGIRQAFDKPVVLIQEKGTEKIFDITPLRYFEYCKELKYHDVLEFQKTLTTAIIETKAAETDKNNVNSLVRLMSLKASAFLPSLDSDNKESLKLDVLSSQVNNMMNMFERYVYRRKEPKRSETTLEELARGARTLPHFVYDKMVEDEDKVNDLIDKLGDVVKAKNKQVISVDEFFATCYELDKNAHKLLERYTNSKVREKIRMVIADIKAQVNKI